MEEEWKIISEYPRYSVSNLGRVKNNKTGAVKNASNSKGYLFVNLYKEDMNKPDPLKVHRLVALSFVLGDTSLCVNHIDGDKLNNVYTNLEWVTPGENISLAWKNGQIKPLKGESCGKSKLGNKEIKLIRHLYGSGVAQKNIGEIFKITQANVSSIVRLKTWKHI